MTIGAKIKALRLSNDYSQRDLADKLGITNAAITKWENGATMPNSKHIERLCAIFNITPNELFSSAPEIKRSHITPKEAIDLPQGTIELPVYGCIAAGVPIEDQRQEAETIIIPACYVDHPERCFGLKVKGDSMNKVIPDGCIAIIDPELEFENGSLCAVCVNGYEATVKRVYMFDFGVVLQPDSTNPENKEIVFKYNDYSEQHVTYIGRVVNITYKDLR